MLDGTGYFLQNPGTNNPSTYQKPYTHTFYNVAAGSQTMLFKTGTGSGHTLNVDDLKITVSVPEPETYAMLLAGLGVMGAVARRRKSNQA